MRILFPIEISNRELLSKLYLSAKFAEMGHISYIGYKRNIWDIIPFIDKPVYFDKGYHKGYSENIYNSISRQNGLIISLDEEIGVDQKNFSTLSRRLPEHVLNYFDLIFLWGQIQYDYLKNRDYFPAENILVTGHPKFELLQEKYRCLYQDQIDTIQSKYGKYILINTSFGFGNNILGTEFVVDNYKSRHPNIEEHIKYEKNQLINFIELIKSLRKKISFNIVIRPHPEENHREYLNDLGNINGVFVLYKYSVIPWILGCEVMLHHSCTTAVEAVMLGRLPVSYNKDMDVNLIPWIPLEISLQSDDISEIIAIIKGKKYENRFKTPDKILSDHFSFYNETTEQIVMECDSYLQSKKMEGHKTHHSHLQYYILASNSKNIVKSILKRSNFWRGKNALAEQKGKGLNRKSIFSLHKKLVNNSLIDKDVRIRMINNGLYKISK